MNVSTLYENFRNNEEVPSSTVLCGYGSMHGRLSSSYTVYFCWLNISLSKLVEFKYWCCEIMLTNLGCRLGSLWSFRLCLHGRIQIHLERHDVKDLEALPICEELEQLCTTNVYNIWVESNNLEVINLLDKESMDLSKVAFFI